MAIEQCREIGPPVAIVIAGGYGKTSTTRWRYILNTAKDRQAEFLVAKNRDRVTGWLRDEPTFKF
jgi:hypothetical protein